MYLPPSTNNSSPSTIGFSTASKANPLLASHRVSHGMSCDDLLAREHLYASAHGPRMWRPSMWCRWSPWRDAVPGPLAATVAPVGRAEDVSAKRSRAARCARGVAGRPGAPRHVGTAAPTNDQFVCGRAGARARALGIGRKKRLVVARDARAKSVRRRVGDCLCARVHLMPPYWRVVTLCGAPDTARATRRLRSFHRDDLGRDRARLTSPHDPGPPGPGPHGFGTPYEPISWPRRAR